ncbi:MAG: nitroreductase [Ketobacteraceae bacterium]|nr:nitroreductase [Ketobacteraceae bacterium]
MTVVIERILSRQSCPKLKAPAPDREEIHKVLQCAMKAPDHARLKPWRFVVITGSARDRLGELFVDIKSAELGELSESQLEKFRSKPLRAPMIIVAIADVKPHPKVPPIEQVMAVSCAVQNMQLALDSLGYGAMWRTGGLAFHPRVEAYFGLKPEDQIVGFLYVGTPEAYGKPPATQQVSETTEFWGE